jgi:preprotein translocase subunit SecA
VVEDSEFEAFEGDDVMDIGPDEAPKSGVVARKDPMVVGAGRPRSLDPTERAASADWSNVGRNDPCPCGSGKKFKKCHGATV